MEFRNIKGFVIFKALRTLGPRWALNRARIALLNRLGVFRRRTPLVSWGQLSLADVFDADAAVEPSRYLDWRSEHTPPFLFDELTSINALGIIGEDSIRIAHGIRRGDFPFFGYTTSVGIPPQWNRISETDEPSPSGHWSTIDELSGGDIKLSWEPSRFSWVFALSRAYARTQDEEYAELFWQLIESWMAQNPPNLGIQWKCGQEASFRIMALSFGFYAFRRSNSTTSHRMATLLILMAAHAKRIEAYIEYAQSQKNNHGISEGVGLWTVGLLFPELKGSARWRQRGKEVIDFEVRRQIYQDGSYVQHSTNYHRVMLHDLAWAIRLGELNHNLFASDVYECFRKSVLFLSALTDPSTGQAPNYGANDGALVLQLSDCAFSDMRPVLQSCYFLTERQRLFSSGPWDEEMVWLNGVDSLNAEQPVTKRNQHNLSATVGGYYTLRSNESWAMIRGARYRDRPSHIDQLHLDLWWRGENILIDPGTYSYNSQPPFDHAFAPTRYHNTLTVDGASQMTKLSRFLWTDWADATVQRFTFESNGFEALQAEHNGYANIGVIHRRAIMRLNDNAWIVVDDLVGRGIHTACLHWQLPDAPFQFTGPNTLDVTFNAGDLRSVVSCSANSTYEIIRAGERVAGIRDSSPDLAAGWLSRYYGRKEPALSLAIESRSLLPMRFVSLFLLDSTMSFAMDDSCRTIAVESTTIALSELGAVSIFLEYS